MNSIADLKAALDYNKDKLKIMYQEREDGIYATSNPELDQDIYSTEARIHTIKQMLDKAMETLGILNEDANII